MVTLINPLRWRGSISQKSRVHWRGPPTPPQARGLGKGGRRVLPSACLWGRGEGGRSPGPPAGAQLPLNPHCRSPEEGAGDGEWGGLGSLLQLVLISAPGQGWPWGQRGGSSSWGFSPDLKPGWGQGAGGRWPCSPQPCVCWMHSGGSNIPQLPSVGVRGGSRGAGGSPGPQGSWVGRFHGLPMGQRGWPGWPRGSTLAKLCVLSSAQQGLWKGQHSDLQPHIALCSLLPLRAYLLGPVQDPSS